MWTTDWDQRPSTDVGSRQEPGLCAVTRGRGRREVHPGAGVGAGVVERERVSTRSHEVLDVEPVSLRCPVDTVTRRVGDALGRREVRTPTPRNIVRRDSRGGPIPVLPSLLRPETGERVSDVWVVRTGRSPGDGRDTVGRPGVKRVQRGATWETVEIPGGPHVGWSVGTKGGESPSYGDGETGGIVRQ